MLQHNFKRVICFLCTHPPAYTHTHSHTQMRHGGVLQPKLVMNHLLWASDGCGRWDVVILAFCSMSLFALFVILAPPVKMCQCGFCTHLNPNSYLNDDAVLFPWPHSATFVTTQNLKLALQADVLKCVCSFPCVYTRKQTIYFLE